MIFLRPLQLLRTSCMYSFYQLMKNDIKLIFYYLKTKLATEACSLSCTVSEIEMLGKTRQPLHRLQIRYWVLKKIYIKLLPLIIFVFCKKKPVIFFYIIEYSWCLEYQLNWRQFYILCNLVRNAPVIVV